MQESERRQLCEAKVTLNGKRAYIRGYNMPFATVAAYDSLESAEWAWETVKRIVENGGEFKG